jgi:hypothetical protein
MRIGQQDRGLASKATRSQREFARSGAGKASVGIGAAYAARTHPHCDRHILLLRLGTPVSIPDAVFNEATRVRTVVDRARSNGSPHLDQIHIAPAEVGIDRRHRLEEGRTTRAGLVRPRRLRRWKEFSAPISKPRRCFCSRTAISCVVISRPIYRNSERPRWEPSFKIDVTSDGPS